MKKYLPLLFSIMLIVCFSCSSINVYEIDINTLEKSNDEDNELIDLVLSTFQLRHEEQYSVVKPMAHLDDYDHIGRSKKNAIEQFRTKGFEIEKLIKAFFKKNRKPFKLTLKSSTEHRYIMDYDGKFADYLKDVGDDGWHKWYEENPNAKGLTTVSIPVMDKDGYVLIYYEKHYNFRSASGYYFLYMLDDGKLKELTRVRVWIT